MLKGKPALVVLSIAIIALIALPAAVSLAQSADEPAADVQPATEQPVKGRAAIINEELRKSDKTLIEYKDNPELAFQNESSFRYMPSTTCKAVPGKVQISHAANESSYAFKAFGKLPVTFSLNQEYYSLKKTVDLPLPGQLVRLAAGIETTLPVFTLQNVYLRINVSPSFYSDNWNADTSTFRIPYQTFLIYKPNEQWVFIAGAAFSPESRDAITPFGGFIWIPNDKWTINAVPVNPRISYSITNNLDIFIEGDGTSQEFEMTKGELKGAILEYDEFNAGAGLEYTFNKNISASLSAGRVFNRRLQYTDSQGKVNIKGGMYSEFRVSISL